MLFFLVLIFFAPSFCMENGKRVVPFSSSASLKWQPKKVETPQQMKKWQIKKIEPAPQDANNNGLAQPHIQPLVPQQMKKWQIKKREPAAQDANTQPRIQLLVPSSSNNMNNSQNIPKRYALGLRTSTIGWGVFNLSLHALGGAAFASILPLAAIAHFVVRRKMVIDRNRFLEFMSFQCVSGAVAGMGLYTVKTITGVYNNYKSGNNKEQLKDDLKLD